MTDSDNGTEIPEQCPEHGALVQQLDDHEKRLDKADKERDSICKTAKKRRGDLRSEIAENRDGITEVRNHWSNLQATVLSTTWFLVGSLVGAIIAMATYLD